MKSIGIVLCAFACATAQADSSISALDTGAGLYSANNGAVIVDPNWSVSLLGTDPVGQTPPGGIPTGSTYLVANNIGFPFGYWLPNTVTSSWLTYSTPIQLDSDLTDDTFQYQVIFTAADSGVIGVNFLSDNDSALFINGDYLGSNPGQYSAWLSTPFDYAVTAGTTYTVDLDVNNTPQGYGNPTGARVEFSGDVNIGPPVPSPSVPDETGPLINGVLLALPLGAGMLRMARKNRAA